VSVASEACLEAVQEACLACALLLGLLWSLAAPQNPRLSSQLLARVVENPNSIG
jgi:hypothetical protein